MHNEMQTYFSIVNFLKEYIVKFILEIFQFLLKIAFFSEISCIFGLLRTNFRNRITIIEFLPWNNFCNFVM